MGEEDDDGSGSDDFIDDCDSDINTGYSKKHQRYDERLPQLKMFGTTSYHRIVKIL